MEINESIWEWATELPNWQNDLIRRLYQKSTLENSELDEVMNNILHENGFSEKNLNIQPLEKNNIPNKNAKNIVKITDLKNLNNIASIDPGCGIKFSQDGLTIIYGENSAGKSSYAKVLKQACRAVDDRTKVHPNIYKPSQTPGTAEIHFENNGIKKVINRTVNSAPEQELATISIFDTDCAKVYAESENSVVFIPTEFEIFDLLSKYQTNLQLKLTQLKDNLTTFKPTFNELSKPTRIKSFIESISYKTKKEDIDQQCIFTELDSARLEKISQDLSIFMRSNPLNLAQELQRNLNEIKKLKIDLQSIEQELSYTNLKEFHIAHQRYVDSAATLAVLTRETFDEQPLNDVGGNPWKKLWYTAKEYHQIVYPDKTFPYVENDAKCLLCQQDLKGESKIRLTGFEEFINDTISQETSQLYDIKQSFLLRLESLPFTRVTNSYARTFLSNESPELNRKIDMFVHSTINLKLFLKKIGDNTTFSFDGIPELESFPLKDINHWIESKEKELEHLQTLAKQNNSEELKAEQSELSAKKTVSERIEDVYESVSIFKKIHYIDKSTRALNTTKLTRKYNELSNLLLSDQFKQKIENELKQLGREHILFKLNSRGVKGKTTIKLSLDSSSKININEILSEGEQRALSIAFFLAEISSMNSEGSIILDDPVSSLDHRRREYVAQRLIQEAKNRQVIIFTHDLVFLSVLEQHSKLQNVTTSLCHIRRSGNRAGIANGDLPWIALTTKKRIGKLRNQLPELKKQETYEDPDTHAKNVKIWYMTLREAWERSVEELLLNGVIERFSPSVQTQRLNKIKLNDEMVRLVNEGMSKSSKFVHDESHAINRMVPNTEEMSEDLKQLDSFVKMFN
ncbi:AAA family ATPase [Bacillus cereus]|uniref:AAA family ATPase n=1 Tax=Bacillus cereus TaxID=1396 RepID=UPI000BF5376F|nr:AAA family ATPase [Bacillus cereus]PFF53626.1 hypothetical protein CN350_27535 [Bacillus cereus]PFL15062.1 hypothetical protein COJ24_06025 [Bacillus cereus]